MRIIAGKYRGRKVRTTVGEGYRPATSRVREALFSMLESRSVFSDELRVLDLFAGSGSLAFEALSRGATQALLVETNPKAAELILKTAADLELAPGTLQVSSEPVQKLLARAPALPYGLVFIDPPYAENTVPDVLKLLLKKKWLLPGAFVVAEVETKPRQGKPLDPMLFEQELELEADRAYGQTRILLWQVN